MARSSADKRSATHGGWLPQNRIAVMDNQLIAGPELPRDRILDIPQGSQGDRK